MTGPRRGYTKKKDRMAKYMEQITKLRIANIAMRNDLMTEAVHELIALNRKFEREDNPKCL